jgi:hypothetical protein
MNGHQRTALREHCRLAVETANPIFRYEIRRRGVSVVLTVNSGYE